MQNVSVTEIELTPIKTKEGLTFFANCVLDGKYFIGSIAVFTRRDGTGFRCVYPTKVLRNGKQIPVFYPLTLELGQQVENAITKEAEKLLAPDNFDNPQISHAIENPLIKNTDLEGGENDE